MTAALAQLERVLVVAPNWLGDAVMALPALADLRRSLRDGARLAVAARPAVASLFALAPVADEVVPLEWRGQAAAVASRRRDVARLRALAADAVLLLPNSFASAWLVRRAGVALRWGYRTDWRGPLLTRAIARPPEGVHQAEYYRHLVHAVGAVAGEPAPLLQVGEAAVDEARARLRTLGWDGTRPLVVVAPGAAYGSAKRWPAASFGHLAAQLVTAHGACVVLAGAREDATVTAWVRALVPAAARAHVLDLAGATTLVELAGVLRAASACVSNDSGAMHLAAALGVPLAAIFGPTRERETAPLSTGGHPPELLVHHVWCRPCMRRECPLDHRCMIGLAPDRVLARVVPLVEAGVS